MEKLTILTSILGDMDHKILMLKVVKNFKKRLKVGFNPNMLQVDIELNIKKEINNVIHR